MMYSINSSKGEFPIDCKEVEMHMGKSLWELTFAVSGL